MMGPDATSCLDLDECIIDPEVTHHECIKYLPSQLLSRFVRMENAKTCWDPLNVSVMTASQ